MAETRQHRSHRGFFVCAATLFALVYFAFLPHGAFADEISMSKQDPSSSNAPVIQSPDLQSDSVDEAIQEDDSLDPSLNGEEQTSDLQEDTTPVEQLEESPRDGVSVVDDGGAAVVDSETSKLPVSSSVSEQTEVDETSEIEPPDSAKPQKPQNVKAEAGDRRVVLTWDAVSGADGYAVAYRNQDGTYTTLTSSCTLTSYTVTGLTNGISRGFLVQSCNDGRYSLFSSSDLVYATPHESSQPVPTATAAGDGQVALQWDAVPEAKKYAVAEWVDGSYHTYSNKLEDTAYLVSNLSNEKVHAFLVQAFVNGAWSAYSNNQLVYATPHGATKPEVSAEAGDKSVVLSWNPVSGASQYAIAVRTKNGYDTYTLKFKDTSFTVPNLPGGVTQRFLVQAYIDGAWSSFTDDDLVAATPYDPQQPGNVVATPSGDGAVTLTWDAVEGATSYAIAEYKNGTYHTFSTDTTGTSYVVDNLANGCAHYFLVQAMVNDVWSAFTDANHVSAVPQGTMKPKVSAEPSKRSATLRWGKVPGTERYAIAYRFDNGPYITLTSDFVGTTYTAGNLVGNVTYHFVVQSLINGAWSTFSADDIVDVVPVDATQPKNVHVVSTGNGTVTLSWDKVSGATKYAIAEYFRGQYRTFTLNCTDTSYTASDVANEMNHRFLVQAYVDDEWSSFGEMLCVDSTPHGTYKPNPKASGGYANITVRWNSVPGASSYVISEYLGNDVYREIARGITGLEYTIWNLAGQSTHGYLVQAFIDAAGSYSSYGRSDVSYATTTNPAIPPVEARMINAAQGYSSRTGYLIMVDRGNCKVGVFTGGRGNWNIQYYWDCTPGKPSTPTISGTFTTGYHKNRLSTDSRAQYATNISGGYFFHSILSSTSELGHQLSHGCVRLHWENAHWIYSSIPYGTTVRIY